MRAIAAAVAVAVAVPAQAAELRPGPDTSIVEADGGRYAAWPAGATTVRVLDERTGGVRTITTDARECAPPVLGSGLMVQGCAGVPGYDPRHWLPVLHDLRSGAALPVAGIDRMPGLQDDRDEFLVYRGIGRRWLAVHTDGYHWARELLLDWRTGTLRDDPSDRRRSVLDPDRTDATRPLCAPLARMREPIDDTFGEFPDFLPFAFVRPYGVDPGREPLRLQRCGGGPGRRLDRCFHFCRSVQLSRSAVTWGSGALSDPLVHAFMLRTGRRRAWRVPGSVEHLYVVHTSRRLYVTVTRPNRSVVVLTGRLPR
jgi:hypothetical protein